MNIAILLTIVDCVLTPILVRNAAISESFIRFVMPLWPKNYEFYQELRALGATNEYIDAVTTTLSLAVVILMLYCGVRLLLEYIYDCRITVPIHIYLAAVTLFFGLFIVIYLTKFEKEFNIYTINFNYSATLNCIILTVQIMAAAVFGSEVLCHAIRYVCKSTNS